MLVFVLAIVVAVGLALAAITFALARWAARRDKRVAESLTPQEAETGQCGACLGRGWNFIPGGFSARAAPCWRCHGSGLPPSHRVSADLPVAPGDR